MNLRNAEAVYDILSEWRRRCSKRYGPERVYVDLPSFQHVTLDDQAWSAIRNKGYQAWGEYALSKAKNPLKGIEECDSE